MFRRRTHRSALALPAPPAPYEGAALLMPQRSR